MVVNDDTLVGVAVGEKDSDSSAVMVRFDSVGEPTLRVGLHVIVGGWESVLGEGDFDEVDEAIV